MKQYRYIIKFFPVFLLLFNACSIMRIGDPEITTEELYDHISFLASDSLKGRYPGTPEDRVAAEYIHDRLMDIGLTPLDNSGFQSYDIITSMTRGQDNLLQFDNYTATLDEDYAPFAFSENSSLSAEVVFGGFGFHIDEDSLVWNDFKGIDVTGKWVIILRGDPEVDNLNSPYLAYNEDRDKVMQAKDLGAGGVLFVSGTSYDPNDNLDALEPRQSSTGIPVFQITRTLADKILETAGQTIAILEKGLIKNLQPNSFSVNVSLDGTSELIQESVQTLNVIAMLEGSDSTLAEEYIVLGAHYDHLGMGGQGSSSRMQDTIATHYGADDNASGVAAMIEIAEKLASGKETPKRSIVFAAFGAEEMGLIGSKFFVENSPVAINQVKTMLNIDMIGRLTNDKNLQIGGVGTSVEGKDILAALSDEMIVPIATSNEGYGPSDHASFYGVDIPVFFFSTGAHLDYHTPNDVIDSINLEGMVSICNYIYHLADDLSNREENLTYQEAGPKAGTQSRRRNGVTLGIMPDFAGNEKNGLRADFVIEGKPAYNGGMKKGDVIVAINGMPVNNIHDYMYRLSKLKFGETINVEVKRGEKTILLLIQL